MVIKLHFETELMSVPSSQGCVAASVAKQVHFWHVWHDAFRITFCLSRYYTSTPANNIIPDVTKTEYHFKKDELEVAAIQQGLAMEMEIQKTVKGTHFPFA